MVTYDLEVKYILEKARTANQFLTNIVLEMDMISEGITEQIIKFCNDIEYTQYQAVDKFAENHGDNPDRFQELIYFDKDIPLTYCQDLDSYDGDYISSETIFNKKLVASACSFEISNKEWLNDIKKIPDWLVAENNTKDLFERYLQKGDMEHAWLALNSEGWTLEERARGLEKLSSHSNNVVLNIVSENWLSGFNFYQKNRK